MGSLVPIPNRKVLTLSEIESIETAINNYNTTLRSIANSKGLAFVDVNAFFTKIKNGFYVMNFTCPKYEKTTFLIWKIVTGKELLIFNLIYRITIFTCFCLNLFNGYFSLF